MSSFFTYTLTHCPLHTKLTKMDSSYAYAMSPTFFSLTQQAFSKHGKCCISMYHFSTEIMPTEDV